MDQPDPVLGVAADAVRLLAAPPSPARDATARPGVRVAGEALHRLGGLLELQLGPLAGSPDGLALVARAVLETWITGHAALVLGEAGEVALRERAAALAASDGTRGPSLAALARSLDLAVYGAADPPKAFQRHVRSFFDEVDVAGVEGVITLFDPPARPVDPPRHEDFVRVSLWVVLFLAFDHATAVGADDAARRARALFDRLRAATDEFYASRRRGTGSSSTTSV